MMEFIHLLFHLPWPLYFVAFIPILLLIVAARSDNEHLEFLGVLVIGLYFAVNLSGVFKTDGAHKSIYLALAVLPIVYFVVLALAKYLISRIQNEFYALRASWRAYRKRKEQEAQKILKRARGYANDLLALLPSEGWEAERTLIHEIVDTALPALLSRRRRLMEDIKHVAEDLDRQPKHAHGRPLLQQAHESLTRLRALDQKTEVDINSCLEFLDLVEPQVRLARHEAEPADRHEVEGMLRQFLSGLQTTTQAERTAAQATLALHYNLGINPYNGERTLPVARLSVATPEFDGPYWWSTPSLENQVDEQNGAMVIKWRVEKEWTPDHWDHKAPGRGW